MDLQQDRRIYSECTSILLTEYSQICNVKCNCSHGRCSDSEHDYFDNLLFGKKVAELQKLNIHMSAHGNKPQKMIAFACPHFGNYDLFVNVFELCKSQYLAKEVRESINSMLRNLTSPMILLDGSLYLLKRVA